MYVHVSICIGFINKKRNSVILHCYYLNENSHQLLKINIFLKLIFTFRILNLHAKQKFDFSYLIMGYFV